MPRLRVPAMAAPRLLWPGQPLTMLAEYTVLISELSRMRWVTCLPVSLLLFLKFVVDLVTVLILTRCPAWVSCLCLSCCVTRLPLWVPSRVRSLRRDPTRLLRSPITEMVFHTARTTCTATRPH